jgi:hypothetical protein
MTAVNYDDFCNQWRLYDLGPTPSAYECEINACFTIYCQNGTYFYSAKKRCRGGMNNSAVQLHHDSGAHGEYDTGDPLDGGLTGTFGANTLTFTLNRMGSAAFVISVSKPKGGATGQSHGGAHGVPD